MITHCPECGDKFDEPRPNDHICGTCAFRLALQAIIAVKRPVVILEQLKAKEE